MAITSPEVGAWIATDTGPTAVPICSPLATCWPTVTEHSAGAPICCSMGTISSPGNGQATIALAAVVALLSGGWIPPGNVGSFMVMNNLQYKRPPNPPYQIGGGERQLTGGCAISRIHFIGHLAMARAASSA